MGWDLVGCPRRTSPTASLTCPALAWIQMRRWSSITNHHNWQNRHHYYHHDHNQHSNQVFIQRGHGPGGLPLNVYRGNSRRDKLLGETLEWWDDVENCLARKTYLKVKSIVTRETWERKTIEAIRSRKLFYAFLLSEPCTKRSIFPPIITQCITVFENHRKSLNQHCERSELRLHAKNGPFWRVFENLKLAVKQCYQTGQF